jgi:hypothetical protein
VERPARANLTLEDYTADAARATPRIP